MFDDFWQYVRTSLTAVIGDPGKRRLHRERVRRLPSPGDSVVRFASSTRLKTGTRPVFCFAPTWRCGSTLLQRLVMSTGQIWMWGEVYTRAHPLRQLVDVFRAFDDEFPDRGLYLDPEAGAGEAASEWIARLSPRPRHMMLAHRAFWDRLCAVPASERGHRRWGLKAVSLSVDHPIYLKRLYPDARIVFLVRNPHRAWLSYRRFRNWYAAFPDDPVFTVQRFARLWTDHVREYLSYATESDSLVLRFEDLVKGGDALAALEDHIGCPVDPSVLELRVSGTDAPPPDAPTLVERVVVGRITGEVGRALGYEAL